MQKKTSTKTLDQARKDRVYLEQAAKLCKYEVNVNERAIYVPYTMEEEAKEDIAVRHLINACGCNIELTIDEELVTTKTEFRPEFRDRVVQKPVEADYPFKKGDVFFIVSSGCILELDEITIGKRGGINFWFHYANRDKPRFSMYQGDIERQIAFKAWRQN